jgi:hypothetical protein
MFDETNFAAYLLNLAKEVRKGKLNRDALTEKQWREVMLLAGNPSQGISPECLAHAIERYLDSLREQANVGKSFYFGELKEGFKGLSKLSEPVRLQIDQLIWETSGGEAIDPRLTASQALIAAAIMHSVEMRMDIAE